jgi:hypothetical protein
VHKEGRRTSVAGESYDPETDETPEDETTTVQQTKTPAQRKRLTEAVKDILLFRQVNVAAVNSMELLGLTISFVAVEGISRQAYISVYVVKFFIPLEIIRVSLIGLSYFTRQAYTISQLNCEFTFQERLSLLFINAASPVTVTI